MNAGVNRLKMNYGRPMRCFLCCASPRAQPASIVQVSSTSAPFLEFTAVQGAAAQSTAPRRLAHWRWPCHDASSRRWVLCVHGLTRQGRDFDVLAQALQSRAHVLAVDVAGRGHSDWLADPAAYQVGTYAADLAQLLAQLRDRQPGAQIDWVGTSMGGLIGMALAAHPETGLRRLVLNDVGPVLRFEALQRIGNYVGQDPSFDSPEAAADYLASISIGFGPHGRMQWMALSRPMLRQRADGRWGLHYDPAIGQAFKALADAPDETAARQLVHAGELALWAAYDQISTPTLLLRGADSDLLSAQTAAEMGRRGPHAACTSFAGVGHAPSLVAPDQVAAVQAFLESN